MNFSNRTFADFFDDEFHINIYEQKYDGGGDSKMNRLRTFVRVSDGPIVARALRALAQYRDSYFEGWRPRAKEGVFLLIPRLESGGHLARTDALDQFVPDETLEELEGVLSERVDAPSHSGPSRTAVRRRLTRGCGRSPESSAASG